MVRILPLVSLGISMGRTFEMVFNLMMTIAVCVDMNID